MTSFEGEWELVDHEKTGTPASLLGGSRFGHKPTGFMFCNQDGQFAVLISGRGELGNEQDVSRAADTYHIASFTSMTAYHGRLESDLCKQVVEHVVAGSCDSSLVGDRVVYFCSVVDSSTLELTSAPTTANGIQSPVYTYVWRRVSPTPFGSTLQQILRQTNWQLTCRHVQGEESPTHIEGVLVFSPCDRMYINYNSKDSTAQTVASQTRGIAQQAKKAMLHSSAICGQYKIVQNEDASARILLTVESASWRNWISQELAVQLLLKDSRLMLTMNHQLFFPRGVVLEEWKQTNEHSQR